MQKSFSTDVKISVVCHFASRGSWFLQCSVFLSLLENLYVQKAPCFTLEQDALFVRV